MARYFALVPAAGSGRRLGDELPKQYRLLAGRPLMRHALAPLCACPRIERVYVVLAAADPWWARQDWGELGERLTVLRCGGPTRAQSVLNGLSAMAPTVHAADWVLVHDAARPCLSAALLDRLIDTVGDDAVGGILAVPVADTLKRAAADRRIAATVPREQLWQAQTPQMFRHGLLRAALEHHPEVTDEAAAVEALGHRPLLVGSDVRNIKVTWPEDLVLAESILARRGRP